MQQLFFDSEHKITVHEFYHLNHMFRGKIQVKICQVDVAAGQKPAAVCYSDKCKPSGYCEGKFDDDPTALNPPQGATVDYSDGNSYGLLGLLGLIALVAIPAGCPEITPTVGMASVSYSDSTNGVAKIDSTATVTCADGYFYGSGSGSKTGTVTCSKPALTFNPSSCCK